MDGSMPITPAWQWSDRIGATGHASLPMRLGLLTAIAALHLSLALGLMHYRTSPAPGAGVRSLSVGMVIMAAPVRDAHPRPVVPASGLVTPAERRKPEPVVRRKPVPVVARHDLLAERRLAPVVHKQPNRLPVRQQTERLNAMTKNQAQPITARSASSPSASSVAPAKGVTAVHGTPHTAARFDADYLDNPRPSYPTFSQRLREEGRVLLKVRVTRSGVADSVTIARSSGYQRLDDSALATVRHWRFIPAKEGDQALDSWVLVPVNFSLRGEA